MLTLPFKANAERRHHIPKQRHRVTNSAAYNAALRQRGSLTVWFTDAAIAAWQAERRTTPGGQPRYSALAIATALTLRVVFRLALRLCPLRLGISKRGRSAPAPWSLQQSPNLGTNPGIRTRKRTNSLPDGEMDGVTVADAAWGGPGRQQAVRDRSVGLRP